MAEAKKKPTKKIAKEAELQVETVTEETAPEVKVEKEVIVEAKPAAKAGKRSTKTQKEEAEKKAKTERKTAETSEAQKPASKPPRSREERAGKKYREAAKLIEKDKLYDISEAMTLLEKTSTTKFDSTVELHVNLGVDPKQADQNVRATVGLPSGTGKTLKIAVVCDADEAPKAKEAGADIAGADEVLAQLEKGVIDFDILIATPKFMPQLGKYARLLGPRGLMPNPKSGTVAANTATAVKEAKAGKVEYRVDPAGIIHLGIGKVSFGAQKLISNYEAVMDSVRQNKPASLKGIYIQKIALSTTMGPSIRVKA